jgi:hypothetical protein
MIQKFSTPEDQQITKDYINQLRARDFAPIAAAIDPSIRRPDMNEVLAKMADKLPQQEPTTITLVGARSESTAHSKKVNTTFEYQFGDKWFLINVATLTADGPRTIIGFNVLAEVQALKAQNRFTLNGKSPIQYSVLILAFLVPLFTLYALLVCIRTRLKGPKWPWILFIIVGLGRITVNWTTGQWVIGVLTAQLLGASEFRELYGPLMISVGVPVGALTFLLSRSMLAAPGKTTAAS